MAPMYCCAKGEVSKSSSQLAGPVQGNTFTMESTKNQTHAGIVHEINLCYTTKRRYRLKPYAHSSKRDKEQDVLPHE